MKIFTIFIFLSLFIASVPNASAYIQDNNAGSWISNVTSTGDFPTRTNTSVNTTNGLMLTNSSDGFKAPYRKTGYAITYAIIPQSVVQWGVLNITANIPNETSIKIQVMSDDGTNIVLDMALPGNSQGFNNLTLNLSGFEVFNLHLPSNDTSNTKIARIRFKFLFETNNTNATPSISYVNFTWKVHSDILPEPSPLASSGWPSYYGDRRMSNFNPGYNESDYYIVRWVSETFPSVGWLSWSQLIFNNSIITESGPYNGHNNQFYSIDKDDGSVNWNLSFYSMSCGFPSITESGMMYNAEVCSDIFTAVDIKTGEPKWSYNFGGGHGNNHVAIGDDGTLYTTRYGTTGTAETLYAFYPNGTLRYTSVINISNISVGLSTSPIAISNGTLYFSASEYNSSNFEYLGIGKLFAINPENGSVMWNYSAGNMKNVMIDSSGMIYAYSYGYDNTTEKNIYAVYPNATLKWERSLGYNTLGWYEKPSIRNDQTMIGMITPIYDSGHNVTVERINLSDGSVISSCSLFSFDLYYFIVDGEGNFYFQDYDDYDYNVSILNRYDSDCSLRWKMLGPQFTIDDDKEYNYDFSGLALDERGWIYSYLKLIVLNETDYSSLYDLWQAKAFALAPWTMSASANSDRYYHGGEIGFTVKTSMPATNLLMNDSNKVQVYLDNGDKVELAHSYDAGDGDTIWTGSYTIPSNMSLGAHAFAAEAGAAWFQTDIVTHFDSPANYTNNTGINVSGAFSVVARPSASGTPPSDSSGRTFGYLVFNPTPEQIEEGDYHEVLYKGWSVVFNIGGESHGLIVENITSLGALITIMSAPQQAFMSVGEERMFEVDGDDYYDIYVRLNSINGNGVNTTIRSVHELIVKETAPSPEVNETAPEEKVIESAPVTEDDEKPVPLEQAEGNEEPEQQQGFPESFLLTLVIGAAIVVYLAVVAKTRIRKKPVKMKLPMKTGKRRRKK